MPVEIPADPGRGVEYVELLLVRNSGVGLVWGGEGWVGRSDNSSVLFESSGVCVPMEEGYLTSYPFMRCGEAGGAGMCLFGRLPLISGRRVGPAVGSPWCLGASAVQPS